MTQYIEEKQEIEVPPATGVEGFLKVVKGILERPRIQEVVITRGKIAYRRFRKGDESSEPLAIDLDSLMPSAAIRNSTLEELVPLSNNAAIAVSQLFSKAHLDGMNPIALVGGIGNNFFEWHTKTTGIILSKDDCYGLPFLRDSGLPNEAIFLCAGYGRRAALPDTVRSYKITIPLLPSTRGSQ